MFIEQDNAGDDQPALSIQNDGTGNGIYIDQNGNTIALAIDSEATSIYGMSIKGKFPLQLNQDLSSGYGLQVVRNIAEAGSSELVQFLEQNAASSQSVLSIQNDGTGASLDLASIGAGISMKSPDGTTYCLTIANGGTTSVGAGACTK